jgi:uncharacterized protein YbjQ (UPF0145 family)
VTPELLEVTLNLGVPLLLIVGAFFIGAAIERRHYARLLVREKASRNFLAVTFPYVPACRSVADAKLFSASVVISIDYFKRFLAQLRNIVGGRIGSYETLLDRGRREAVMRLKEAAHQSGYHALVNVRLETSRLATSTRQGQGTAGVEVLAFGTALKFAR